MAVAIANADRRANGHWLAGIKDSSSEKSSVGCLCARRNAFSEHRDETGRPDFPRFLRTISEQTPSSFSNVVSLRDVDEIVDRCCGSRWTQFNGLF